MAKALIKLVYRQVVNAASTTDFERKVFHTSYQEFLMKSQAYNMERKFKSFEEIKTSDGRANSLHYKLAIAVNHFIDELKNVIPGLHDHMGNNMPFETPNFKLIASDIIDRNVHKVSIDYITPQLTLFGTIGNYFILAFGKNSTATTPVETFMIEMQAGLSVAEYQDILSDI